MSVFVCNTYYFYGILPVNTLGGLVDHLIAAVCAQLLISHHISRTCTVVVHVNILQRIIQ